MTVSAQQVAMIGQCEAMLAVKCLVAKLATKRFHVLVLGETGAGKEVVAQYLHALSQRPGKCVEANCSELQDGLFESDVFGHERGAFTGADRRKDGLVHEAHRGTLFLDELGELTLKNQAKFLRFLETGMVRRLGSPRLERLDVRIVAATNRDLEQMVHEGTFREDLYFRLRAGIVRLPPVRERGPRDIRLLTRHFIASDPDLESLKLDAEVTKALEAYYWPGNVRQIRNVLREVSVHGDEVELSDLEAVLQDQPDFRREGCSVASSSSSPDRAVHAESTGKQFASVGQDTRALILHQLGLHETIRARELCEILLRSRSTIWRHLRSLQMAKLVVPIGNGRSRRYALAERCPDAVIAKPQQERTALAVDFARRHGRIRRLDLIRLTHVSDRTASRDLRSLTQEGSLKKVGRGRGTHYILAEGAGEIQSRPVLRVVLPNGEAETKATHRSGGSTPPRRIRSVAQDAPMSLDLGACERRDQLADRGRNCSEWLRVDRTTLDSRQ